MRTPHERPDQAYRTDLALAENCRGIVARTVDDLGGLDILVNNVAYQNPVDDFTDLTEEQWRRTFAVNIDSYFHTAHAAVDHLGGGGCIINTSSKSPFHLISGKAIQTAACCRGSTWNHLRHWAAGINGCRRIISVCA